MAAIGVGAASLAGSQVLIAGPALAADVNCPSATPPTLVAVGTYQLDDSAQLMGLRDDSTLWDDTIVLGADIDMGTCVWHSPVAPVSSWDGGTPFGGVFDGDGHSIRNLTVAVNTKSLDDSEAELAAFIGHLASGGTVKDINFVDALVTLDDTTDYDDSVYNSATLQVGVVAALAGDATGPAYVSGVSMVDAVVRGWAADATRMPPGGRRTVSSGALVGLVYDGVISDVMSLRSVVQGVSDLTVCPSGLVSRGTTEAGGLVGIGYGTFDGLHATDDSITASSRCGESWAGGAVGNFSDGATTAVRVEGVEVLGLSGSSAYVGGAVGAKYGDFAEDLSVASSDVEAGCAAASCGYPYVGGAIGFSSGVAVTAAQVIGTPVRGTGQGAGYAGGVIGETWDDTLSRLASDSTVTLVVSGGGWGSVAYAGGGIGYLMSNTPGPEAPLLTNSYATGSVSVQLDDDTSLPYAGGLVGAARSGLIDLSYATGSVSVSAAGVDSEAIAAGLIGASWDGFGAVTESFSTGASTASAPAGDDTVGGLVGTQWVGTTADSYWNMTTSGLSTSDGGTGLTSAQMQEPASFAGWTIVDGWQAQTYSGSPALPTSPFWGQCDVNSGFPFLLWQYDANPCAAPPPPLPPTYPPSAPRDVVAMAGDRSATVSWSVPTSSGSFPVSRYQVVDESGANSCLYSVVADTGMSCEFTELTNGDPYRFRVRALNGAGWGAWSGWSDPVTPEGKSIVIIGTRDGRLAKVIGTSSGLTSDTVRAWVRLAGQATYSKGSARAVDDAGDFTWKRRTTKKVSVFFTTDGITSNTVKIKAGR